MAIRHGRLPLYAHASDGSTNITKEFELEPDASCSACASAPASTSTRRSASTFLEADVDFPLAGGSGAPDPFAEHVLVLATGLLFHLPG